MTPQPANGTRWADWCQGLAQAHPDALTDFPVAQLLNDWSAPEPGRNAHRLAPATLQFLLAVWARRLKQQLAQDLPPTTLATADWRARLSATHAELLAVLARLALLKQPEAATAPSDGTLAEPLRGAGRRWRADASGPAGTRTVSGGSSGLPAHRLMPR